MLEITHMDSARRIKQEKRDLKRHSKLEKIRLSKMTEERLQDRKPYDLHDASSLMSQTIMFKGNVTQDRLDASSVESK